MSKDKKVSLWKLQRGGHILLIVRQAENDVAKRLPSILPPMTLREVRNY
jgi:hypothetical protein